MVLRNRPTVLEDSCRRSASSQETLTEMLVLRSADCLSANAQAECYAATFSADAGSVLELIVPFRPVGKNPPWFTPAFPNAR